MSDSSPQNVDISIFLAAESAIVLMLDRTAVSLLLTRSLSENRTAAVRRDLPRSHLRLLLQHPPGYTYSLDIIGLRVA